MTEIILPNDWEPRVHQMNLWRALHGGQRRAVAVWHRRAGKDSVSGNFTSCAAHERTGLYWHCGPTKEHVRKFVWDNIDGQGRKVIDQWFPPEIVARSNAQTMLKELKCGSIWQCIGSDNYDSWVGANPVGVVFSEWSLCDPKAWQLLRPILAENGGWAVFIFTPRGKNHAERMFNTAKRSDNWFCELLTVEDTFREDGSRLLTEDDIQEARDDDMSEPMINQEFYCSFEAFNEGVIFAEELQQAQGENRIGHHPIKKQYPVHTSWDLGTKDPNAVWLWQAYDNKIVLVDYHEAKNKGMVYFISWLNRWERDNQVVLSHHLAPHDIGKRVYTDSEHEPRTRQEIALQDHAFRFERVLAPLLWEQHEHLRRLFPRLHFHETGPGVQRGLDCLMSYEREWDENRQVFIDQPVHNWASHGASALLTLACGFKEHMAVSKASTRNEGQNYAHAGFTADFDVL